MFGVENSLEKRIGLAALHFSLSRQCYFKTGSRSFAILLVQAGRRWQRYQRYERGLSYTFGVTLQNRDGAPACVCVCRLTAPTGLPARGERE